MKTVLTIAGFDGGGGAGIQADLKTFAALGCYGVSVLTALPVQNTCGVKKVYSIDKQCVSDQLQTILDDFEIHAIKIGMLHTKEIVTPVGNLLRPYAHLPIVLDPVMTSSSGSALICEDALEAMIESLFPLVTLLTPNLNEASEILRKNMDTKEAIESAAIELSKLGPKAVMIKGGHFIQPTCDDCLYYEEKVQWFSSTRIASKNLHGTGCTFASAIASFLAQGYELVQAISLAKHYLFNAVKAGVTLHLGNGRGPLHHFFPVGRETSSFRLGESEL